MPGLAYFDSDVFHRVGTAFSEQGLAPELRERIVVSPLTLLEVLSHLTLEKNEEILAHIKAVHNWVNPKRAGLLAWPTDAITQIGFQKKLPPDDFTKRMEKTLNVCLATDSPDELRDSAAKLKDALDGMKKSTAADFNRLVEGWRKERWTPERFSEMWVHGIAHRTKSDPASRPIAEIVKSLSAYHEYEEQRLLIAVKNPQYKPDDNDLIDSEQLPYLGDEKLHFVTCDRGYAARIKKSPQAIRIHRVAIEELATAQQVESLLQKITA
jgi:hypothetical protein